MALRQKTGGRKANRPTIGLLFDNLYENYGATIWGGVVEYAREQDINLICFSGGSLHSPELFYSQRNVIYDMVSPNNVDGFVAISSSIGNYIENSELNNFFSRFATLPIVSIGVPIMGSPCIRVDNEYGTRLLLEHLIREHGYRNIAFVRGPRANPDAEARFDTYRRVLKENGIPLDPAMVAPGTFDNWAGREAVDLLFGKRELDIDVVVVSNDYMALYAIQALQDRGMNVPEDVAVVGFDDIKKSSGIIPAITTVHQPLTELGRQATETLLAILMGKKVPSEIILPTKLVIRRSCGCFSHTRIPTFSGLGDEQQLPSSRDEHFSARLGEQMVQAMKSHSFQTPGDALLNRWVQQLISPALADLKNTGSEEFLITLEKLLAEGIERGVDVSAWYHVISILFGRIMSDSEYKQEKVRIETLWKETLVFIGEAAEQQEFLRRINGEDQALKLNRISQALITAFNKSSLKSVILRELPTLGIESCFISLYVGNKISRQFSRLFLEYNKSKSLELRGAHERFSSPQLIPGNVKQTSRRSAFLVMPLFFKTDELGFIMFEIGPMEAMVYETLTSQLSSALKGAKLVRNRNRLEREILEISGREQQRIGQDLHDGLGQILTGVTYLCKVLEEQLRSKGLEEAESMSEISRHINECISQTRNLARGLFPVELEQNGLISALEELAQRIEQQFGITCRFSCLSNILIRDNSRALHVYRIAQEAVNNAIKHGAPDRIDLELTVQGETITLLIKDDGMGIVESFKEKKGMGLKIMKYRANMIDAKLEILRNKNRGTSVLCTFKTNSVRKVKYWQ